ncbi:putative nucleoside phosphatase [Carnobacterium antarcticum]|nr:putative nucleoside phosphatase [Carnobacterium sp. CP1]
MMKKVTLTVTGRVQGVGFRYMTKMVADQIGVFGLVRNEMDGSVYIEANGEPQKIDAFIEEIRKSPTPSGNVEHLEITEDSSLPVKDKFSVSN